MGQFFCSSFSTSLQILKIGAVGIGKNLRQCVGYGVSIVVVVVGVVVVGIVSVGIGAEQEFQKIFRNILISANLQVSKFF